jgi:hypothetical protein
MSGTLPDLQADAAVLERLLGHLKVLLSSLELRLLNGVHLEKAVEMLLLAPPAFKIVVADDAAERVDGEGVLSAGQLHQETLGLPAEEVSSSLLRSGEVEPLAGGGNGGGIMYFGLDRDKV